MSEDTDAKAGGRRRRTTRAGRRRAAGRSSSEHVQPDSSEQWSPAWSSDPDTLPADVVEEVEEDVEPAEGGSGEEGEEEGEGEGASEGEGSYAAAHARDPHVTIEDGDARPTREIVVTPFTLAELQDEEKTNPRIRVGDMGPQLPAEVEPAVGPAVAIWSRPSTRIRTDSEESSAVAVRPAVIITPSRVISDRPPPMRPARAAEAAPRSEAAVARAPAVPPEAAPRAEPAPARVAAAAPEIAARAEAPAARVAAAAPEIAARAEAVPARASVAEVDVASAAASRSAAAPEPARPPPPPQPAVLTSFEQFDDVSDAPPARAGFEAATAAPVTSTPASAASASAAEPLPETPLAPTATPIAAPAAPARSAGGAPAEAAADEGSLQIVDVDVAELEHARRSRTPPPPPPDARGKAAPPKRPPPPPAPSKVEDDRQKRKQVRQWWERFFSDDYLMSVRPATPAQIARQVDFIEQSLGVAKGGTILDVGCGLGLHAVELTRRGYLVVGLDLSLAMITRAAELAQQQQLKLNVVHADIREMEFDGAFDGVICMGTTFGFFDDDANRDMLARLHQALRPGGRLLLDMVNRDYVIGFQPNLVWFEGDECVCMEESDFNYFNSRLTVKRTMMREDGKQSNAEYSVRLYSLHELGLFMQQVGFRVIEVSGQEAIRGAFFGANSPRVLMLAERRAPGRPSAVIPIERGATEQGRASGAMPPERGSAEQGRTPAAVPPERGSTEIPKIPKPD